MTTIAPLKLRKETDTPIFEAFNRYGRLTIEQLVTLTGRDYANLRERISKLCSKAGVFDSSDILTVTPYGASRKKFYSVSKKGVAFGVEKNLPVTNAAPNEQRTPKNGKHDEAVSDLLIAIDRSGLDITHLEWRPAQVADRVWLQGESAPRPFCPDGLVGIRYHDGKSAFVPEVEKSGFGNARNNEPNVIRKARAQKAYRDQGLFEKRWRSYGLVDFAVLYSFVTEHEATYFLGLLKKHDLALPMFWVTHEDLWRADVLGDIWRTPADYERGVRYSLRG